jgi:protein gp37
MMKREWVISIRRECRKQGVPFFFKQWGGVRKSRNGRTLDGRTYDEMPTGKVSHPLRVIESRSCNLEIST